MLNIASKSQAELTGGTSRINAYNVATIVDHLVWVVESGIATPMNIGISTPYAAQVAIIMDTVQKLSKDKPSYEIWNRYWRICCSCDLYTANSIYCN